MAELHETLMGKRLIERVFPDIADNLAKIAIAMEQQSIDTIGISICYYLDENDKKVYDIEHMQNEFEQKLKELTS
jgi:hypothetical protein